MKKIVMRILPTMMFILLMIIACECVAGEETWHELQVTLYDDGHEHSYILTTNPNIWTCDGTFWASGDAYNKEETTSDEYEVEYTLLEYDLDDIDLYDLS